MSKFSLVTALSLMVVALGCSGAVERIPLAPVSGKVTSKKPLPPGLGLVFTHVSGTQAGNATISADGTFKGEAPVGENKVTLYGAPQEGAAAGHADSKSSKINAAFWNEATTPWTATVDEKGKEGLDFSLDVATGGAGGAGHGSHKAR